MKKTLVAIAALAAFGAQAQSSVTIGGTVDMGIQALDLKGNKVTQTGQANGSATSNFTFSGVEEINPDLSAKFRWEIDPDLGNTVAKTAGTSATGTTSNVTSFLSNGYSYLGLASKSLGEVQFGTLNFATLSANGDGNVGFGTAVGSGYRATSFDAVRAQNTVSYETPAIAGLSAKYVVSTKNDKQDNYLTTGNTGNAVNQAKGRDGVKELSLAYVNGPLKLRYADLSVNEYTITGWGGANPTAVTYAARGTGNEFSLKTLSANYKLNALEVGAFYQKTSSDALFKNNAGSSATAATAANSSGVIYDRKAQGLAAAYDVTPVLKLMVNVAQVKVGDETNTSSVDNTKTKLTGLGADYALSKRTTLYARMEKLKDDAKVKAITGYTAATDNNTYKATAVGIRHSF